MTVQSETTAARVAASRDVATARRAPADPATRQRLSEVAGSLAVGDARFAACAPGRLDVMGGSADYAGSLVVGMTMARRACVAVQRRADGKLVIVESPTAGGRRGTAHDTNIPMSAVNGSAGPSAGRAASLLGDRSDESPSHVLAAVACLLHGYAASTLADGLSVAYDTTLSPLTDAGAAAAMVAATVTAVAAACHLTIDPATATNLCRRAENEWLGVPVGGGDAMCSLRGEANALVHGCTDAPTPVESTPLPADVALVGIDTGVRHARAIEKYCGVRTASFMGRTLIRRIVHHEGAADMNWDGRVARVPVAAYVEQFRDRIPTKLKGSDYLELFGDVDDPLTSVAPDRVYRVRSRTEHHIYENARAVQFVERIRRAAHKPGDPALLDAGELMYASHWSYGQRCGLGSVETDLLVNLVRQFGRNAGVFGAKISGRGCGGVVIVLMHDSGEAHEAVAAAIEAYQTRTGRTATLVTGSADGALVAGATEL